MLQNLAFITSAGWRRKRRPRPAKPVQQRSRLSRRFFLTCAPTIPSLSRRKSVWLHTDVDQGAISFRFSPNLNSRNWFFKNFLMFHGKSLWLQGHGEKRQRTDKEVEVRLIGRWLLIILWSRAEHGFKVVLDKGRSAAGWRTRQWYISRHKFHNWLYFYFSIIYCHLNMQIIKIIIKIEIMQTTIEIGFRWHWWECPLSSVSWTPQ